MIDRIQKLASKAAFGLCLVAVIIASLMLYDDVFQKTYCVLIDPCLDKTNDSELFLSCSNVRQSVVLNRSVNIRDNMSEQEGWRFYSIDDPSQEGILVIEVIKDRNKFVFYPRLQGKAASIAVVTAENNTMNQLFMLKSRGNDWTPISRQYHVNTYCADHGWLNKQFPLHLTIVLTGQTSQIWHRDGKVFF